IGGARQDLGWTLDWRLTTSDLSRAVLEATAATPYRAVAPYAGVARRVGRPSAGRAGAQARRWNPPPNVVPAHRALGTPGRAVHGLPPRPAPVARRIVALCHARRRPVSNWAEVDDGQANPGSRRRQRSCRGHRAGGGGARARQRRHRAAPERPATAAHALRRL